MLHDLSGLVRAMWGRQAGGTQAFRGQGTGFLVSQKYETRRNGTNVNGYTRHAMRPCTFIYTRVLGFVSWQEQKQHKAKRTVGHWMSTVVYVTTRSFPHSVFQKPGLYVRSALDERGKRVVSNPLDGLRKPRLYVRSALDQRGKRVVSFGRVEKTQVVSVSGVLWMRGENGFSNPLDGLRKPRLHVRSALDERGKRLSLILWMGWENPGCMSGVLWMRGENGLSLILWMGWENPGCMSGVLWMRGENGLSLILWMGWENPGCMSGVLWMRGENGLSLLDGLRKPGLFVRSALGERGKRVVSNPLDGLKKPGLYVRSALDERGKRVVSNPLDGLRKPGLLVSSPFDEKKMSSSPLDERGDLLVVLGMRGKKPRLSPSGPLYERVNPRLSPSSTMVRGGGGQVVSQ